MQELNLYRVISDLDHIRTWVMDPANRSTLIEVGRAEEFRVVVQDASGMQPCSGRFELYAGSRVEKLPIPINT